MRTIVLSENDSTEGIQTSDDVLVLKVGHNLKTGIKDFEEEFGTATSLERDLLATASAILAYDVAHARGEREDTVRKMQITIPVVNHQAFSAQKKRLQRLLWVLSDDNWNIEFTRATGAPESLQQWPKQEGKTLLFSGGLDSLAAAVELLDEFGCDGVQLASHITQNTTTQSCQTKLHKYLQTKYQGDIHHVPIKAYGEGKEELEYPSGVEFSQRTRSFVFLTIASLAARRRGMSTVVMIAENGPMAIHVPLNGARIGAFSTRTAFPEYVAEVAKFFSEVLDYQINIENPFLYKTKSEVVEKLVQHHDEAIQMSNSCWRSSRIAGHCGQCVPCYIRRIALEYHGSNTDKWLKDMFVEDVGALPADNIAKRNLSDLAMFVDECRTLDDLDLVLEHPELDNLFFDRDKAIEMYKRFADEAHSVFSRYPKLSHLMS